MPTQGTKLLRLVWQVNNLLFQFSESANLELTPIQYATILRY
ncbi:hypothetical protein DSUL_20298 [Desulfovibrionales bacterium]